MASQGYLDWIKAGRPYTLIRPARALQRNLIGRGITVWDFPDESHQKAVPPEDHTPYSATGWPGSNARWKARGLDIMPRSDSKAHRKENADIARQLIRDRDAGVPGVMWIKYINWTDEDGACHQERWMSAADPLLRTTRPSTDRGHIHVSGRSDVDNDARADEYDPIGRMNGETAMPDSQRVINTDEFLFALTQLTPAATVVIPSNSGKPAAPYKLPIVPLLQTMAKEVTEIRSAVAGGTGGVTHEGLVTALKEALTDPAVAAELAAAVNDDAARRMQE